jgi:hypothetical protein
MSSMSFAGTGRILLTARLSFGMMVVLWNAHQVLIYRFRFWWRDARMSEVLPLPPLASENPGSPEELEFSYPVTFMTVATISPLSTELVLSSLVTNARIARRVEVPVPIVQDGMDLDGSTREVEIQSDGLLLYWAPSAYEYGTSPMSLWIPPARPAGMEAVLDLQGLER